MYLSLVLVCWPYTHSTLFYNRWTSLPLCLARDTPPTVLQAAKAVREEEGGREVGLAKCDALEPVLQLSLARAKA